MAPAGDNNLLHPASRRLLNNLGLMFHDIRSLVTSIQAGIRLLQRRQEGKWDPEVEAIFQETVSKVHTLGGVAEEFLLKFRKEGQQGEARLWVDLGREVVEPVLAEMQDDIARQGITLDNRICLLPPDKRTVRGQQATLKSIFRNIVSNAVKYGGSGCSISIDRAADPAYFRLLVHNSGVPLSRDGCQEVFGGGSPGQDDSQGMGLGLFLGREAMRSQGGDISCEPDPRGANFVITLPLA
jgi:signal transduction histidine kinase